VAIVRLSSLGDVVHGLPVAHALRAARERVEVTWVVEERESALLTGHPDVDRLVTVDTRRWRRQLGDPRGAAVALTEIRSLARRLRDARLDVALDLQGLWKSGFVTALTRAPLRVGFAGRFCRERPSAWFTNRHVTPPVGCHVVAMNVALLDAAGVADAGRDSPTFSSPPFPVDRAAEAFVQRWWEAEGLKPATPPVVLNPGAGAARKRWPVEAYRRLGDELAVRLGARVIVTWGPGEEPLARGVAQGVRTAALVAPPTSIPELAALLRRAAVVVGSDTGPIHVAAAWGTPTIGLYGPTSGRRNGPFGPRTRALESPTGRMEDLPVERVAAAAEELVR
jgi:lipopolysaccharide heptosyltransferase I